MRLKVLAALVLAVSFLGPVLLSAAPAQAGQPPWGEWWLDTWHMTAVWRVSQGAGVTVAVIDQGVDGQSGDLKGSVLRGTGFTMSTACPPTCWTAFRGVGDTDSGLANGSTGYHGTDMAELIAGHGETASLSDRRYYPTGVGLAGKGIAPQATILPVNIAFGGLITNGSYQYGLPGGIRWAVQHGAKVISISLDQAFQDASGNDICPALTEDAVGYALQHNVVIVGAAGNDGSQGNPAEYPGMCPGVLTVGAVDQQGGVPGWSERQPYVDVAAPGVNVPAIQPDALIYGGHPSTLENDGTSSSTALVAGAVALMRSRYPSMPAREVVQRIIDTAVSPAGGPVPSDAAGYGEADIQRALDVRGDPVAASAPNPVYAAFDRWLASAPGRPYASAGTRHAQGDAGLVIGIVAAAVVVIGAVFAASLVSRSRRRGRPGPARPGQRPAAQ
jgi:subtilisin family serine protease